MAQYGMTSRVISATLKTFAENQAFNEWLTLMYDFLSFGNEEPDKDDDGEDIDTDEGDDDEWASHHVSLCYVKYLNLNANAVVMSQILWEHTLTLRNFLNVQPLTDQARLWPVCDAGELACMFASWWQNPDWCDYLVSSDVLNISENMAEEHHCCYIIGYVPTFSDILVHRYYEALLILCRQLAPYCYYENQSTPLLVVMSCAWLKGSVFWWVLWQGKRDVSSLIHNFIQPPNDRTGFVDLPTYILTITAHISSIF